MFGTPKPQYSYKKVTALGWEVFHEKEDTFPINENCDKYKEDFETIFGTYPPPCQYCLKNQDCKKLIHQMHPAFKS